MTHYLSIWDYRYCIYERGCSAWRSAIALISASAVPGSTRITLLTDGKSYEPIFLRLPLGINQPSLANQFYLRAPRRLVGPGTALINPISGAPIGRAQNGAPGALRAPQTPPAAVPGTSRPNSRREHAFPCRNPVPEPHVHPRENPHAKGSTCLSAPMVGWLLVFTYITDLLIFASLRTYFNNLIFFFTAKPISLTF